MSEATSRLIERTLDDEQLRLLTEWVAAVAHHALVVDAAVRKLHAGAGGD